MVARKTISIYGNAHVSGNPAISANVDANAVLSPGGINPADGVTMSAAVPAGWGTLGYATVHYNGVAITNGPFTVNAIITGGTSGRRARIIRVGSVNLVPFVLTVERLNLTDPVPSSGSWFVRGETITADNPTGTTATILDGAEQGMQAGPGFQFQPSGTLLEQLCNPVLNAIWPNDATQNIFWDRSARRADILPVTTTAWVPAAGYVKVIGATSGATGYVVGIESGLALASVVGTFQNPEQINIVGGTPNVCSTTGTLTVRTVGEWVPYSVRPNIAGAGSRWWSAPAGSESSGKKGYIGCEPLLVRDAFKYYQGLGEEVRILKLDTNHAPDLTAGGLGGACYGVVKCTGTFGTTWSLTAAGATETLRCDAATDNTSISTSDNGGGQLRLTRNIGSWPFIAIVGQEIEVTGFTGARAVMNGKHTVIGVNSTQIAVSTTNFVTAAASDPVTVRLWTGTLEAWDSGAKFLYVTNTMGQLASGHVINGVTSGATATATGNCVGWSKDQTHWVALLADFALATSKLTGGDTLDHKLHVMAPWEGEILIPATQTIASLVSRGFNNQRIVEGYGRFMAAMVAQTGNDDLVFACFRHKPQSHAVTRPSHATFLRLAYESIRQANSNFRIVDIDQFEATSTVYGDVRDEDAAHTSGDEVLYLETYGYPMFGKLAWEAFRVATAVPIGQDLDEAPVILITGQSHAAGQIHYTWWIGENDPELAKLPLFPPFWGADTIDNAIWQYNAQEDDWQPYNVFNNATTFGPSGNELSSFEASLLLGLKARYGSIYCIKVGYNASSLQRGIFSPAAWESGARTPIVATCTVTVASGSGTFTASSGTPFATLQQNQYAEIAGALEPTIGSGGNNTTTGAAVGPAVILSVGGGGTSVTFSGAFVADASPKSVTFTPGPVNLRDHAGEVIRNALSKLVTEEKRIPRAIAAFTAQGEGDLTLTSGYQAAMQSHIEWCRSVFGHRIKGEDVAPHVWVMTTDKTPLDATTTREQITALRDIQRNLGSVVPRYAAIDTANLPLDADFGGSYAFWPRNWPYNPAVSSSTGFGVHHTPSAYVRMGWLCDAALGSFAGIPAQEEGVIHFPFDESAGAAAPSEGEDSGGSGSGSFPPEVVVPGDGAGAEPEPAPPPAAPEPADPSPASILSIIDSAIANNSDVAAYTVNGRFVQMRGLNELLAARKLYQAEAARQTGLRRTKVYFP